MAKTCSFCGAAAPLTGEHVLPAWLGRIGLPNDPVTHTVGRLNRSPDERGMSAPFVRKVRDVCAACNGGWISALDAAAKTAFADPVRGRPTTIDAGLCGPLAAWLQKICLVNMLTTQDATTVRETELGAEMRALFAARARAAPLPETTTWIGRHTGERLWSICLTPMVAGVVGLPPGETPNAYVMTVVIGELLLHGVRFTTPLLSFGVATGHDLEQLWPGSRPVAWPCGAPAGDATVAPLQMGRFLRPTDARFTLEPWKPATDGPDQEIDGQWMRLATPCGEHYARYPLPLARDGQAGSATAFVLSCACPRRYLVLPHRTGVRFTCESRGDEASNGDLVRAEYARLRGVEELLGGAFGGFMFKRLESSMR